jgi:hypothetical protein
MDDLKSNSLSQVMFFSTIINKLDGLFFKTKIRFLDLLGAAKETKTIGTPLRFMGIGLFLNSIIFYLNYE